MKLEETTDAEPWVDQIVADVRTAREALLAEAGHDLRVLCRRLRERQSAAGRKIVRREPRRIKQAANGRAE